MITTHISSHFINYACPVKGATDNYLVVYDVSRYDPSSGHTSYRDLSCTCKHWSERLWKSGGYCKHIRAVLRLTPEEGGMSLWKEDDMTKPVFMLDYDNQVALAQWAQAIGDWGAGYVQDNASEVVGAIQAINQGVRAFVPGFMYMGEMVAAVKIDIPSANAKLPRHYPDLDFLAKKQALIQQFDLEDQMAAAAPVTTKRPIPAPPVPNPIPAHNVSARTLPTPKRPGS